MGRELKTEMDAKTWSAHLANRVVDGLLKAEILQSEDIDRALRVSAAEVFDRLCLDGGQPPNVEPSLFPDDMDLAREIERTLQGLIWVPRLNRRSLVASREFWNRCKLLTPHWHYQEPPRIYVDGFVALCKWNSWKVYTDALEAGLSLWAGYAGSGRWTEHAWCMYQGQIVESTWGFRTYYGAELNAAEREIFRQQYGTMDLEKAKKLWIWTMVDGRRDMIRYDEALHANTIGRERDPKTGAIKEGLGRSSKS